MIAKVPVCIDLDGTLLRTDVLSEALVVYIVRYPWRLFNLLIWFLKGRAHLKERISEIIDLDMSVLPVNQQIVDLIYHYKTQGHQVLLVTAAPQKYGAAAATHFDFFDEVMTSRENCNLRSKEKAKSLVEKFGEGQFIYAGNSAHDLPVWSHAQEVIAINAPFWVLKKILVLPKTYTILEEGLLKGRAILSLILNVSYLSHLCIVIPLILLIGIHFYFHKFSTWGIFSMSMLWVFFSVIVRIIDSLIKFSQMRQHQTLLKKNDSGLLISKNNLSKALMTGAIPIGFTVQLALTCLVSIVILGFCI